MSIYDATGIFTGQFLADTTPKQFGQGGAGILAPQWNSQTSILLTNFELNQTVYIGFNNQVTPANGYPLLYGDAIKFSPKVAMFLVVASGTADMRWLSEYK